MRGLLLSATHQVAWWDAVCLVITTHCQTPVVAEERMRDFFTVQFMLTVLQNTNL